MNEKDENLIFTNQYKKVNNTQKKHCHFNKNIFVPFISGIAGATLLIGTCFGIPNIKAKILNNSTISTSSNPTTINDTAISLTNYSDTATGVAKKVLPSIVGIQVDFSVNSIFSKNTSTASASGSGIIISEDGYILTNNHIVNSSTNSSYYQVSAANDIKVYLYNDSTPYNATIVGTDDYTDLAVIKIDATNLQLTPAELGDSDSTQIGEFAMAIGNPLGLQSSITCGIISALNREITENGTTYTLIQTDAAINSGNSGGALVNSKGQVIGINTLKLSGTGIEGMGFAIPINSTKDIYSQLIQYSKVKRPYIGLEGVSIDEQTSKYYNLPIGVYIKSVENFSPAQKSGLKVGDVITKINNIEVKSINELNVQKNQCNIGDTITLTISRNGEFQDITITLEEQP